MQTPNYPSLPKWSTLAPRAQYLLLFWLLCSSPLIGDTVPQRTKQVIGATASVREVGSGLSFPARVDTGATTCSIHVEEWEIENPEKIPYDNIGKTIRFRLKDAAGQGQWLELPIADRVKVRSSTQDEGDYHGRYKVWLTLKCQGLTKEVLVTLNDRADMDYPLLIGRNFLRDDFLVDVGLDSNE